MNSITETTHQQHPARRMAVHHLLQSTGPADGQYPSTNDYTIGHSHSPPSQRSVITRDSSTYSSSLQESNPYYYQSSSSRASWREPVSQQVYTPPHSPDAMYMGQSHATQHKTTMLGQVLYHNVPPSQDYHKQRSALLGTELVHQQRESEAETQHSLAENVSEYQATERRSTRIVAQHTIASNKQPDVFIDHLAVSRTNSGKRRLDWPSEDEQPAKPKKPKRQRTTETPGAPPTKRGFHSQKRIEAAHWRAQNAAFSSSPFVYTMDEQTGGEKRLVMAGPGQSGITANYHPELQTARCMSNKYKNEDFPRCVACTRRWAGDTCRFQGIRFFMRDDNKVLRGISFLEMKKNQTERMTYPSTFNVPLTMDHIKTLKRMTAKALLPTLIKELEHCKQSEVICRPRENEVRATCDTCMTSLFCNTWMCRICGREACEECFGKVKAVQPEDGIVSEDPGRSKPQNELNGNPFFLSCTKRKDHCAKDFSPVSRFTRESLESAIAEMKVLVGVKEVPDAADTPDLSISDSSSTPLMNSGLGTPSTADEVPSLQPAQFPQVVYPKGVINDASDGIPYHPITRFDYSELTENIFRPVWARGEPILVNGVTLKHPWDPEFFIIMYGQQPCNLTECQTEANKRSTVEDFFRQFGKYEGRTECWKLKDWPPSTDFKTAFPVLYSDFSDSVPIPNYVRRDGALNVSSHFPTNAIAPDLGPKMYNAMANHMEEGSFGSTRLHMDMADALNIMTYSASKPDGSPGCAAWDLFRAEDSDKLRAFVRDRFGGKFQHDPIHSQRVYIDRESREVLWRDYGVASYRVYQKPGQAIFIPAGCAHQVCNLADSVKIAIDFVSPENTGRCEKLTTEFREQNTSSVWKEDVLQLRTMMWFAWQSCSRLEKDVKEKDRLEKAGQS